MSRSSSCLLLRFRSKDTRSGVTRGTVKALAKELGVSEMQVVHMALSKLANDVLRAYEPDNAPLTASHVRAVRKYAAKLAPRGKVLRTESLF